MEWDQRAFAWLYRSFRRVSGRGAEVDEGESPLEALTPRFETLSNLLTGTDCMIRLTMQIGNSGIISKC